jgi:alkylation response protein AidB-like acyl-CoA dehydrogenase
MSSMIFGVHAALEREPLVGEPLVMRGPVPRRDQDRDLRQLGRKYRVEPQHPPSRVACRAISGLLSQAIIGAGGAAALAGDRFVVGLFLVLAHFARRKQLQPHLFPLVFQSLRLCEYTRSGVKATSVAAWVRQRYIEFHDAAAKVDPTTADGNATMSDLENFRRETRAWLEANCPPEMRRPMTSEDDTFWGGRNTKFSSEPQRVWFERMRDKGWTVPHWPREYGGGGLDPEQTKIVRQEMAALGARQPLTSFGISMLGPALLKYGTDAQKKEHLPKIAAGLIRWCQGYSEPNAGSDLASLQTRAESDGDDFIINGQKIWTSYANFADWIFCLVRTDATGKKHDGISFILFDMASKGVSTKPILLISGRSPFCETFFDNVRVPKSHVVGTVNRGWDVAKYLLQHERAMISGMGERGVGRPLGQVAADSVGTDEQGRLEDPMLRGQIATFEIDEAALACAAERAVDLAKAGQAHPAFSSAMKYYGTELNKRRYEILMSAGGVDALEWESERSKGGARPRAWLRTKANSIEGGTSEVMLGIVAKRILDLPGA